MELRRAGRRHPVLLFEDERARPASRSKLAPRTGPRARGGKLEAGQRSHSLPGGQRTHAGAAGQGEHRHDEAAAGHEQAAPAPAVPTGATRGGSRRRRRRRRCPAIGERRARPRRRPRARDSPRRESPPRGGGRARGRARRPSVRAAPRRRRGPEARSGATRSTSPIHSPSGPLSRTRAGSASHAAGVSQMARVRAAKVNGGGLPPRATRGRGRRRHRTTRAAKVPRGECSRSPRAGAR